MTSAPRCPACGARNPVAADWCSQCYESLATDDVPAPTTARRSPPTTQAATDDGSAAEEAADAAAPTRDRSTSGPTGVLPPTDGLLPLPGDRAPDGGHGGAGSAPTMVHAGDGRFRDSSDGLEWCCDTCREWNPIEIVGCRICGNPFMPESTAEAAPRRVVAPGLLLAATVVLPGAGHALLGQWGQAFSRGVLALVWGLGGLSLLLDALASGQPMLPALPLLLGWVVLVGASANDVLVAGHAVGGRVLLTGRPLLWLVVGVIGATIAAAFVGALGAVAG